MNDKLSIVTYNSQGHGPGRLEYISSLTRKFDFVLIQEHWLFNDGLRIFERDINECCCHGVSGMNENELLIGRPYGGVAILWKNSLTARVTPVNVDSKRMCAVIVEHANHKSLLINVYMPLEDKIDEYIETLQCVSAICDTEVFNSIILGGDFNVDRVRHRVRNTQILEEFITNESLSSASSGPSIDYTFESKINFSRSKIDHFFVSDNLVPNISACDVLHEIDNCSDHSPIVLKTGLKVDYEDNGPIGLRRGQLVNWDKVTEIDIEAYKACLDDKLHEFGIPVGLNTCHNFMCNDHKGEIDLMHDFIVTACVDASSECLPILGQANEPQKTGIAGWNDHVKDKREHAIFWHSLWKSAGCPRNGVVADVRRATRARYHLAIKQLKQQNTAHEQTRIAESHLESRGNDFWKMIRKIKGGKKPPPNKIDDANDEQSIANKFADKYEQLYSSVGYDQAEMNDVIDNLDRDIMNSCMQNKCECKGHTITHQEVREAVGRLNKGKHEGEKRLFSDHLIYGTNLLYDHLAVLFTSMLTHSYFPETFKKSVIIPIPKNSRKSMSDSENYRGITLSSILGKVLDHIIIRKCPGAFKTSDLQFGFKTKSSTTQCTFVMQQTIDYYRKKGSNVYAMFLDASKAFDRVQYTKLFKLLIEKGCCPLIARFLARLYVAQECRVKWNSTLSRTFSVRNGIKQGGVLSPILFCVYIDVLLERLEVSGLGCYVGHVFMGAFGYADDIVILSPMKYGLMKMLRICNVFSVEYHVTFNPTKSILLFYGIRNRDEEIAITWNGRRIIAKDNTVHLGHIVGTNSNNNIIDNVIAEMYKRTNCLISMFGFCDFEVKYRLFKAYVMSLYGCALWDYSHRSFQRFCTAWRNCLRKLFRLPRRTHRALLPSISRDEEPDSQVYRRFSKFFMKCTFSQNSRVLIGTKLTLDEGTRASRNIRAVSNHFGCTVEEVGNKILYQEIEPHGQVIRDLMNMRDRGDYTFFMHHEVENLLYFICVQ